MAQREGITADAGSIRHLYADWTQYRSRLTDGVRDLTDDQLAIRAGPDHDPIWALAAHCAVTRVYWLCGVLGEPGAETTPFPVPNGEGWEDHLDHPRTAAELVVALDSTDAIVERCLDTWTVDMLDVEFDRSGRDGVPQRHTRRSVVLRMLSHDAYHAGEISQLLGLNGLPAIDLWTKR